MVIIFEINIFKFSTWTIHVGKLIKQSKFSCETRFLPIKLLICSPKIRKIHPFFSCHELSLSKPTPIFKSYKTHTNFQLVMGEIKDRSSPLRSQSSFKNIDVSWSWDFPATIDLQLSLDLLVSMQLHSHITC